MFKKLFLISSLVVSIFSFSNRENSFKDLDYLITKETIKDTTLRLDLMKKRFDYGSEEYLTLHKAQQILLDNLPVDSFSTYSRIQLHNIIDTRVEKQYEEDQKRLSLSSDTDINTLYLRKQNQLKRIAEEKSKKTKETEMTNEEIQESIKNSPYAKLYGKGK